MQAETKSLIDSFITLRVLVSFLGEKNQFGWWDTSLLDKTGQRFLEVNFPRSGFSAGLTSATEAAKQLHDSRIGKGHVFHLFRMLTTFEEKLFYESKEMTFLQFDHILSNKEDALTALRDLVQKHVAATDGPIHIGGMKNPLSESAIDTLAQHYSAAFDAGKKVFPYFTAD